ncbi:hypothetical protein NIES2100_71500 [Calothrix sp. NIES-2100]|nr:hypothetical protein NIES2100_71500 [Calothrix sp. NIES-2100]
MSTSIPIKKIKLFAQFNPHPLIVRLISSFTLHPWDLQKINYPYSVVRASCTMNEQQRARRSHYTSCTMNEQQRARRSHYTSCTMNEQQRARRSHYTSCTMNEQQRARRSHYKFIGYLKNWMSPSSFTLHPSYFILHPSPFTLHPSPFILQY